MNRAMKWIRTGSVVITALVLTGGCAAFRASTTDVNVEERTHFGSTYDYTDMRFLTEEVASELLGSRFLNDQPQPPIMMIAGVQNRTMDHRDLKAMTDRVRTMVIQSGKAQFVNEARREELLREQGYQAAHATAETQVSVGRQLGAKYMLSGSLIEMEDRSKRQVRVSKQQRNYYKLTIEITDLESGLIAWTTEKEFARQASLPLIGW
ncbi:MAG: penicillin-binding protein activator LpoB [Verrucomicrobia bacterium]|nr:penicillin-binding protein activator LpoB [Verrucomicrobiota bacterium]MBU1910582.1 penicillin-binding protein activator LpoB [Verrucomicrobiota bacterium]